MQEYKRPLGYMMINIPISTIFFKVFVGNDPSKDNLGYWIIGLIFCLLIDFGIEFLISASIQEKK